MPRTPQNPTPPPAGFEWAPAAAIRLGITMSTLYKWRQLKRGPQGVSHGRRLMYRIADIESYLNGLYETATAPNPESRAAEPRMTGRRYAPAA